MTRYQEPPAHLTRGLYTIGEAARLCQAHPSTVRSWVTSRGGLPPVVTRSSDAAEPLLVSFIDLLEIWAVALLRAEGVPLQKIRKVREVLAERLNSKYPLARTELFTLGSSVCTSPQVGEHGPEKVIASTLEEVLSRQRIFPMLREGLSRICVAWEGAFPRSITMATAITLNPLVQFGKPVESERGIRTSTIFDCYKANGCDSDAVGKLFNISPATVKAAVQYEQKLAA